MFGSGRVKSDVRRQQIVAAARALLADVPLDQLSTRQIARAIGISQPALFRHFGSRDELLLAAIAATRAELAQVAEGILSRGGGPCDELRALARELARYIEKHPGLPRLMFANIAAGDGPLLGALGQLHSAQTALVTELVRQGQHEGVFERSVNPLDAATLFVGILQGLSLARRLNPNSEPMELAADRLFDLWLRGLGGASSPGVQAASVDSPALTARAEGMLELDVRPLLSRGTDPLETVLTALADVGAGGVLKLSVPFRPAPLLALLQRRGHRVRDEQVGPKHWTVEVLHAGTPDPEDLRDLEPPAPLERVLDAVKSLPKGAAYLARLPRRPRLLFPHLEAHAVSWLVADEADGSALLRVFRPL